MRFNRPIASLLLLGSLASAHLSALASESAARLAAWPSLTAEFRMDLPKFLDYLLPFCAEGPEEKALRLKYA